MKEARGLALALKEARGLADSAVVVVEGELLRRVGEDAGNAERGYETLGGAACIAAAARREMLCSRRNRDDPFWIWGTCDPFGLSRRR